MNKKRIDYLVDKILNDEDDAQIYDMGEPGYESTRALFANWNKKSLHGFTSALEKAGVEPVFYDEWIEIDGKAYRSVSDGSPLAWVWFNDEPRLKQDIRSDYDTAEDFIADMLMNDPNNADTIGLDAYLMQMGFKRQAKDYEIGLRAGCKDDPVDILKSFNDGGYDVVFQVTRNNDPWVTEFTIWTRSSEWEDPNEDSNIIQTCFVHAKSSPDSIIAVFLDEWFNDILLAAYHYPCGNVYGFHPGIFDDITNGKPIYGTGGEDHWMAMSDTYIGAFMPVVKRLHQEGYKVSVKPCPDKAWVKPGPSNDLLRVNNIKL